MADAETAAARLDAAIWNPDVAASDPVGDAYRATVVDQYTTYIESAEKVSDRRALSNTFFLTLNTAIVTVIGIFWKDRPAHDDPRILALPLLAALTICMTWWLLLRSYRQLSTAKWRIIGRVEQRLPLRLWGEAEWKTELDEGRSFGRYVKLSVAEQWVPAVFAGIYVVGFLIVLLET